MSDAAAPTTPAPASTPSATTPPAASATPAPAAKQPPKPAPDAAPTKEEDFFELVVDGKPEKLTREQAIRQLQKAAASEKRFREAQDLTKRNRALMEMLKDPERVEEALKELGHDPDALAQRRLQKFIEQEQLSPEQKEIATLKAEKAKYEAETKKRAEADAQAKQQEADKAAFAQIEKGFIAAAEKHGLEGTPDNLHRMVEVASEALELGLSLTEEQVIAEVREREDRAFGSLESKVLKGLKGEALAKRLGPAVVEEVLKWSVERIRGGQAQARPKEEPAAPAEKPQKHFMTEAEFRKKFGV